MGAALGLILGAATGYAGQKYQERKQQEQQTLQLAYQNPEAFASNPDLLKHVKSISPESADVIMAIGQQRQAASQQFAQMFGPQQGTAPAQGAPTGATPFLQKAGAPAAAPSAPVAAAAPTDQITQMEQEAQKMRAFMATHGATLPPDKQRLALDYINKHEESIRQMRSQAESEKRQSAAFAQQEEMQAKREAAAEKAQAEREAAAERRQSAFFAHADDMERRHEDFRDHLEALKDARTKGTQDKTEKTVIASLTKERNSIVSKFKGTDADQTYRQQEVNSYNQGLDVLAAGSDHPEKFEALKLELGEATGGVAGYFKKPGEVKPAAADSGDVIKTDTSGKRWKLKADRSGWEPADGGPAATTARR